MDSASPGNYIAERADPTRMSRATSGSSSQEQTLRLLLPEQRQQPLWVSFEPLNKGSPVVKPKGTGGVGDPTIIQGGDAEAGKKCYIFGRDVDIGKTAWGAS
jgi:hypothetical protein